MFSQAHIQNDRASFHPDADARLEEEFLVALQKFALLPVRRGTGSESGVLRRNGPDARAVHTHAVGWVRAPIRNRDHPPEALLRLQVALSRRSPEEVAEEVRDFDATRPSLL